MNLEIVNPTMITRIGKPVWHRTIWLTAATLAAGFVSYAFVTASRSSKNAAPSPLDVSAVSEMLLCEEPEWNVGSVDVAHTPVLEHSFTLRNLSASQSLEISDVVSTCGCLITTPLKMIPPSESSTLGVTLSVAPVEGPIRQSITVRPALGRSILLSVSGTARLSGQLRAIPEAINFGTIESGSHHIRTLTVQRNDGTPVRVKSVDVDAPGVVASVSVDDPHVTRIQLDLHAAEVTSSTGVRGTLRLLTDSTISSAIVVPVIGSVRQSEPNAALRGALVGRLLVEQIAPGHFVDLPLTRPGSQQKIKLSNIKLEHETIGITVELVESMGCDLVRIACESDNMASPVVLRTDLIVTAADQSILKIPLTVLRHSSTDQP